jgi:hypothetical protein
VGPLQEKVRFTHSILYEFRQSKLDFLRNLSSWSLLIDYITFKETLNEDQISSKSKKKTLLSPEAMRSIKAYFLNCENQKNSI